MKKYFYYIILTVITISCKTTAIVSNLENKKIKADIEFTEPTNAVIFYQPNRDEIKRSLKLQKQYAAFKKQYEKVYAAFGPVTTDFPIMESSGRYAKFKNIEGYYYFDKKKTKKIFGIVVNNKNGKPIVKEGIFDYLSFVKQHLNPSFLEEIIQEKNNYKNETKEKQTPKIDDKNIQCFNKWTPQQVQLYLVNSKDYFYDIPMKEYTMSFYYKEDDINPTSRTTYTFNDNGMIEKVITMVDGKISSSTHTKFTEDGLKCLEEYTTDNEVTQKNFYSYYADTVQIIRMQYYDNSIDTSYDILNNKMQRIAHIFYSSNTITFAESKHKPPTTKQEIKYYKNTEGKFYKSESYENKKFAGSFFYTFDNGNLASENSINADRTILMEKKYTYIDTNLRTATINISGKLNGTVEQKLDTKGNVIEEKTYDINHQLTHKIEHNYIYK